MVSALERLEFAVRALSELTQTGKLPEIEMVRLRDLAESEIELSMDIEELAIEIVNREISRIRDHEPTTRQHLGQPAFRGVIRKQ